MSKLLVRCALALVLAAGPAVAADQFINVLTGGTSGVYYPLGVALANAIGKSMPQVKTSVQATKASVENLNLLQAGRGELAFTLGDSLSDAWKGNEDAGFKTPLKKLRGIAAIYPNYIQIVARADAGIKTLADLKGKKVSVGAPKSGTELNARAILGAAGMSYKDFAKVEYLPFGESVELMKIRQIDVSRVGKERRRPAAREPDHAAHGGRGGLARAPDDARPAGGDDALRAVRADDAQQPEPAVVGLPPAREPSDGDAASRDGPCLAPLRDVGGPRAVELRVAPAAREQLVVASLLDDAAVLEHDDDVRAPDRREAVRDDE